jgi:hypothetical protein
MSQVGDSQDRVRNTPPFGATLPEIDNQAIIAICVFVPLWALVSARVWYYGLKRCVFRVPSLSLRFYQSFVIKNFFAQKIEIC